MASNARNVSRPFSGMKSPVRKYRSEPQSKRSDLMVKPPSRLAMAFNTFMPASITSGPIPSPGIAAMLMARLVMVLLILGYSMNLQLMSY